LYFKQATSGVYLGTDIWHFHVTYPFLGNPPSGSASMIEKCGFPKPPILVMPIDVVEPSRQVAAPEWSSPYCLAWNDGCEECMRVSVADKPKCRTRHINHSCKRHEILCNAISIKYTIIDNDDNDYAVIGAVCSLFQIEIVDTIYDDGTSGATMDSYVPE